MKIPGEILHRISGRFGIEPGVLGEGALRLALENRFRELSLTSESDYLDVLEKQPEEESAALAEKLLVPESWFFRDSKTWQWFGDWAREQAARKNRERKLRLLSAPCATGQEPYSVAIELLHAGLSEEDFEIHAVDLSADFLAVGQRGVYRRSSLREWSWEDPRSKYFHRFADDTFEVKADVRACVCFHRGNLYEERLELNGPFDVVFCRNLLIYFGIEARKRMLANVSEILRPDGYLVVGHADNIFTASEAFHSHGEPGSFVYRLRKPEIKAVPQTAPVRDRVEAVSVNRKPLVATPKAALPEAIESIRALADAGETNTALAACRRLVDARPTSELFTLLGNLLLAQRQYGEAETHLRRAVYLDATNHEALLLLALLSERGNRHAAAARYRKRAQRIQQEVAS